MIYWSFLLENRHDDTHKFAQFAKSIRTRVFHEISKEYIAKIPKSTSTYIQKSFVFEKYTNSSCGSSQVTSVLHKLHFSSISGSLLKLAITAVILLFLQRKLAICKATDFGKALIYSDSLNSSLNI